MIKTVYDETDPQKEESYLHDLLGSIVLKVVEEPSFQNVADLCPAMSETRTAIGLKEYPFAVGVDWDGTLNRGGYGYFDLKNGYSYYSSRAREKRGPLDIIFFKIGTPLKKIRDLGWINTRRELLNGYLPVISTNVEYEHIEYQMTVFAYAKNMSSEEDMEIFLALSVKNISNGKRRFKIEMCANPEDESSIKMMSGDLEGKASKNINLKIVYKHSAKEIDEEKNVGFVGNIKTSLTASNEKELNAALEGCRNYWHRLLDKGMKIDTTEQMVNNAYKAWQIYNFINTRKFRKEGEIISTPHSGSGFYAETFGKEATAYIQSLLLTGYPQEAQKYLDGLLSYQNKEGLYSAITGLADNGLLLMALSEYFIFSNDYQAFQKYLPAIKKLSSWVINSRNLKPDEKAKLTYGLLLKGRISADMVNGDYTYRANVCNWKGLEKLHEAFSIAGMKLEAKQLKPVIKKYYKDILISMKRASFPEKDLFQQCEHKGGKAWSHRSIYQNGSLTIVPMTPVSRALEWQFGGGYYYAVEACQILETCFFEPNDLLYKHIIEFMEKRGGISLGLLRWNDYAGLNHAYTYGYLLNKMKEDKINQVLLGFYSMFAYGMSRDTFSAAEVTDLVSGKGSYGEDKYENGFFVEASHHHRQPHTHSNTQQIRLLRMMLVREEKKSLLLAFSVPRSWSKKLHVIDASTIWGKISYSISCKSETAIAIVEFSPLRNILPETITLRIRHPEKKKIKSVEVEGKKWDNFCIDKEFITLPGSFKKGKLSIIYK